MSKYRKKPVIIDAFKWTGDRDQTEDTVWINNAMKQGILSIGLIGESTHMFIETLEGTMIADAGDYIIRGVKGEIYPCKPDIFEMTYEKVNSNSILSDFNKNSYK